MSHPPVNYPLLESVKSLACDPYFTALEVTKVADDGTRAAMKKILEQSHMKVCYGAQPRLLGSGLNPNDINEEGRKKAEATLIEAIDEAEYLGAKGIAFLAGKWEIETKNQAYSQLLKTTRKKILMIAAVPFKIFFCLVESLLIYLFKCLLLHFYQ